MALSRKHVKKVSKTRRRYIKRSKKNRKYTKKMRGGDEEKDKEDKEDILECIRSLPDYINMNIEKKVDNNDIEVFYSNLYHESFDDKFPKNKNLKCKGKDLIIDYQNVGKQTLILGYYKYKKLFKTITTSPIILYAFDDE